MGVILKVIIKWLDQISFKKEKKGVMWKNLTKWNLFYFRFSINKYSISIKQNKLIKYLNKFLNNRFFLDFFVFWNLRLKQNKV